MLVKAAGSSPYNGVFTLLNTSYSGRPAYQHEHHQLYLFYSEQFNCSTGAWVISDGLSSTSSTSMFAIDSAVDPVLISADTTWLVYDRTTDQFTPDSRLSLACYVSEWQRRVRQTLTERPRAADCHTRITADTTASVTMLPSRHSVVYRINHAVPAGQHRNARCRTLSVV